MDILLTYKSMLKELGHQGWWPLIRDEEMSYFPKDYSRPQTKEEKWEICAGALLTQNTNWGNVEKALLNLDRAGVKSPEDVLKCRRLEKLIRPSGFFRQKSERLKGLAAAVQERGGTGSFLKRVSREELLALKGIGPETADSILLYAGKRAYFVVDAYTRRLFGLEGGYEDVRARFEKALPRDWKVYNEMHALIVKKAKLIRGSQI